MPATASARAAAPSRATDASRPTRLALYTILAGAAVCVLAAVPLRAFDLDRYTVPKELALHATALGAGLLCLAAARRLTIFVVDALLLALLGVTLLSTLGATNAWLGFQALGVTLSGSVLFWSARTVARAGFGRQLLVGLAAAVVLAMVTALVQTYAGGATSSLFSLLRAPGGTFGNRNFVAHLAAIGLPVLLLVTVDARTRTQIALGALGVGLVTATLFLTRSRAGWLGAGLSGAFLVVEGLWLGRLWHDARIRSRLIPVAIAATIGVAAAWLLPNRLNWRSESPYLESLAGMANYKEGSGRGRLIQYRNSLTMAAQHPVLGVGPGNWPVYYPKFMAPNDPSFDADDIIPTNPWPSSDWVAMISERGFLAGILFGLIGLALGFAAWSRVRQQSGDRVFHDLALVATLMATAIVGAFDAVLLLPAPTFLAWTIIGALASTARPIRELSLDDRTRRRVMIAAAIAGGLFVARAATRLIAMEMYENGSPSIRTWTTRIDPGSYRLHMLLGTAAASRGQCATAIAHGRAAAALFPNYPAPRHLLRRCGARKVVSVVTAP